MYWFVYIFFERDLSMHIFRIRLSKKEFILWGVSEVLLVLSFMLSGSNLLLLGAAMMGVTSLILLAKGEPLGQFLTICFSVLYAVISCEQRLYSEMITYLGMTLPSAFITMIIWIKHPFEEGRSVVRVSELNKGKIYFLMISSPVVTLIFYYLLKTLDTPLLIISTISILTSYVASMLMFFRSRHYAIFYALNDLVLITIWTLTSIKDTTYLPMIICFMIFFVNDSYAFLNWKSLKDEQSSLDLID